VAVAWRFIGLFADKIRLWGGSAAATATATAARDRDSSGHMSVAPGVRFTAANFSFLSRCRDRRSSELSGLRRFAWRFDASHADSGERGGASAQPCGAVRSLHLRLTFSQRAARGARQSRILA
jgi:hypothetical protein